MNGAFRQAFFYEQNPNIVKFRRNDNVLVAEFGSCRLLYRVIVLYVKNVYCKIMCKIS